MNCEQLAIRFNCHGSGMVGIIDLPERPLPRGVLVVAGQPYSRLGAQRQFAMLARALARRGIAVMRFDHRGVGDSEGCDYNDSDVRTAVQEFCEQVPSVREVVLLAPGSGAPNDNIIATASACARLDRRVRALLLLDPRRRGGRRATHLLAAPTRAPAPIGAALFWRRAQTPRRSHSSQHGARLAGLAEQLCAFPGQVLVMAGAGVAAGELAGGAREAPAAAELLRLRVLVARADHGRRVSIVDDSAGMAPAAIGAAGGDCARSDADSARADACASWIVSW